MTEFSMDVSVDDVAIRDTRVSMAVNEPMRAMILDMLAETPMTVSEVHADLEDRGYDRTENTVRHHVNELRDAGLVEIARFEEGRGGTRKYYEANTIVLSYQLPERTDAAVEAMADTIRPGMDDVLSTLDAAHGEDVDEVVSSMAPCEHCRTQKYETYVLLAVLRRAFLRSRQARDE